jgi:Flp pilus assembly protein TadG
MRPHRQTRPRAGSQRGLAAIELALVAPLFFLLLFALLEFCRALFLFNTLQEVTRHAARSASVSDFSNAATMTAVRKSALFASGSDSHLPLGGGIDETYVRIDYLSLSSANVLATVDTSALTPLSNIATCAATPNAASCIRFVRVQVCQPGSNPCQAVPYTPMVSLLSPIFSGLSMPLATALSPAESLGVRSPCGLC